jgi:hypothetical protein
LIYKSPGSWARLKTEAGFSVEEFDANSKYIKLLEGGLARLFHTNSYDYLTYLQKLISNGMRQVSNPSSREEKFFSLFYYTIWMDEINRVENKYKIVLSDMASAVKSLQSMPWMMEELSYLVRMRLAGLSKTTRWLKIDDQAEIELYGCYSADEIHLLLENKLGRWQVLGTQYNRERKFAMVFVTINKSDKEYSASTRYMDYAISADQFHWQSKNDITIDSDDGQRIIHQRKNDWKYILFVRDSKRDEYGNTNAYYCLGFIDYNESHGECPMNVIWDMREPIPGFILESAKAV